jgi:hypothetical protein
MTELRRFEITVPLVMAAFLTLLGSALLATGHAHVLSGLVTGALLGLANMAWMVGTAKRLLGHAPTTRMLQMAATVRFLCVAGLFGALLIVGRVDPVGAVVGYGCFPIASAVAGWRILHTPPGVSG